jgi:hypothetical protein
MKSAAKLKPVRLAAKQMRQARDVADLARLVNCEPAFLQHLADNPPYDEFEIPKPNGKPRLIECPREPLRQMLKLLARHLSCLYYFHRTMAAYGFVINPEGDTNPRTIFTNAMRHIGCRWLLNIDMKDFFHQVKTERVKQIVSSAPFALQSDAAQLFARLTTRKGRLPMGANTSPALSNFAAVGLDNTLQHLALRHGLTYTRYVDDLTFSSSVEITNTTICEIKSAIYAHGFMVNQQKILLKGPAETKVVTGLQLGEHRPVIPQLFFDELHTDIQRLTHAVEALMLSGFSREQIHEKLKKFEKQIEGKLQFTAMIYGENSTEFKQWHQRYEAASNTVVSELESINWRQWESYMGMM